jgi:DNA-binding transcriptional regulator YiaG
MPETDFAAWERRLGLSDALATAKALGISRPAVYQLRSGATKPSPPTQQLMRLIEADPKALKRLLKD